MILTTLLIKKPLRTIEFHSTHIQCVYQWPYGSSSARPACNLSCHADEIEALALVNDLAAHHGHDGVAGHEMIEDPQWRIRNDRCVCTQRGQEALIKIGAHGVVHRSEERRVGK